MAYDSAWLFVEFSRTQTKVVSMCPSRLKKPPTTPSTPRFPLDTPSKKRRMYFLWNYQIERSCSLNISYHDLLWIGFRVKSPWQWDDGIFWESQPISSWSIQWISLFSFSLELMYSMRMHFSLSVIDLGLFNYCRKISYYELALFPNI